MSTKLENAEALELQAVPRYITPETHYTPVPRLGLGSQPLMPAYEALDWDDEATEVDSFGFADTVVAVFR